MTEIVPVLKEEEDKDEEESVYSDPNGEQQNYFLCLCLYVIKNHPNFSCYHNIICGSVRAARVSRQTSRNVRFDGMDQQH